MKKNPALRSTLERMSPGNLSKDGFLGTDDRPVSEIVAADVAALEALGLDCEQAAELLDELHRKADQGLESPVVCFDGKVTVQGTEVKGGMPCPFGCGVRTHKACIRVRGEGLELVFTPMQVHLVRDHGFFEGRGSPFRMEPEALAALFHLCGTAR